MRAKRGPPAAAECSCVPDSRLEWLVLALGSALLIGVIYLVVGNGTESPSRAATSHVARTAPLASVPATTVQDSKAPTRTDTPTRPEKPAVLFNGPSTTSTSKRGESGRRTRRADVRPEKRTQTIARFRITAARGSSWVLVRAGTSSGPVLYSGIMNKGQTVSVRGRVLWVSFGAAANLDARLNGSALELGTGTYDATIGRRGLRKVPFGTIRSP
jgi:hypothetical protein